jgi:hypothetical protein
MLLSDTNFKYVRHFFLVLSCFLFLSCCAHVQRREIEVTAYCGCKKCCGWTRGSWKYLKLNFWNRYYASGPDKGARYHGRTASGKKPRAYNPGLVSTDSVKHPWMIPVRVVFFWLIFPHPGTIAADTDYYPFGTLMYVPGYGKGVVEDRGSAIKGANRVDIFYRTHRRALKWGRQRRTVKIKLQR